MTVNENEDKGIKISRKRLEKQFLKISKQTSKRVMSCFVINKISRIFRFDSKNVALNGIAVFVISLVVYLSSYLISRLSQKSTNSVESLLILAIPALFTGLAFWVVKCMHDVTLVPNRKRLSIFPHDHDGLQALIVWFEGKFLIGQQIFLSIIFG